MWSKLAVGVFQYRGAWLSSSGVEYRGSYDGFCSNAQGGDAEHLQLRWDWYQQVDGNDLAAAMDICDQIPGCVGMGAHYDWWRLYGNCADMRDWDRKTNGGDVMGEYCAGSGPVVCPDAANYRCGNGQPTHGCYAKTSLLPTSKKTATTPTTTTA